MVANPVNTFLSKYWYVGAIAVLAIAVAFWVDSFIRESRIEQSKQELVQNKRVIDSLSGEIAILRQERDSLIANKDERVKVINRYIEKLKDPEIKIETNPDTAYTFLTEFAEDDK